MGSVKIWSVRERHYGLARPLPIVGRFEICRLWCAAVHDRWCTNEIQL